MEQKVIGNLTLCVLRGLFVANRGPTHFNNEKEKL